MAEISDETLEFIVKRAKNMHHGSITIHINAEAASKVDVEVVERARFKTDDVILPIQRPPRALPDGKDPPGERRRG